MFFNQLSEQDHDAPIEFVHPFTRAESLTLSHSLIQFKSQLFYLPLQSVLGSFVHISSLLLPAAGLLQLYRYLL